MLYVGARKARSLAQHSSGFHLFLDWGVSVTFCVAGMGWGAVEYCRIYNTFIDNGTSGQQQFRAIINNKAPCVQRTNWRRVSCAGKTKAARVNTSPVSEKRSKVSQA